MEMKQISDTTLKITISMEDLEERGMELKDFLIPQEKTEEFFYSVMDELELPEHFKDSGMLSFRVTPRKDRLDIFVTKSEINRDLNLEDLADLDDISKMSPEDFFKTLEQSMYEKGDQAALDKLEEAEEMDNAQAELTSSESQSNETADLPDYIHFVLEFKNLKEVVAFSHALAIDIEASELFKEGQVYYVTLLINMNNKPLYYPEVVHSQLLEYAAEASLTRPHLVEHATKLLDDSAVEQLMTVNLV